MSRHTLGGRPTQPSTHRCSHLRRPALRLLLSGCCPKAAPQSQCGCHALARSSEDRGRGGLLHFSLRAHEGRGRGGLLNGGSGGSPHFSPQASLRAGGGGSRRGCEHGRLAPTTGNKEAQGDLKSTPTLSTSGCPGRPGSTPQHHFRHHCGTAHTPYSYTHTPPQAPRVCGLLLATS